MGTDNVCSLKVQVRVRELGSYGGCPGVLNSDTPSARSAYSRHDGGILPDQVTEDFSPEHLQELKSRFYHTRVSVTHEERIQIEEQTRDQDNSDQQQERRKRPTASVVGGISKMKIKKKRQESTRTTI